MLPDRCGVTKRKAHHDYARGGVVCPSSQTKLRLDVEVGRGPMGVFWLVGEYRVKEQAGAIL